MMFVNVNTLRMSRFFACICEIKSIVKRNKKCRSRNFVNKTSTAGFVFINRLYFINEYMKSKKKGDLIRQIRTEVNRS